MRRRFKKNMAAVIAVSVAVSMCSVTAFANTDVVNDNSKDNETIVKGSEEMQNNYGTVTDNDGTINNNYGTVTNNDGTVTDNKAADTDHEKAGSIETNNGTVTENNGDIGTNEGTVETNGEDGTIKENADNGVVKDNYGTITENSAKSSDTSQEQYKAEGNGGVENNYGTIVTNSGFVENNEIKEATESDSEDHVGTIKENTGTVKNNNAVILDNSGHVEYNSSHDNVEESANGYTVDKNAIVINKYGGSVYMNFGIVENNTGATVTYNNGEVYNYGDHGSTVTGVKYEDGTMEYGVGTEYFSVSVTTANGSTSYGDGFNNYKDNKWLGQKTNYNSDESKYVTKTSSSTVTVTPSSGYQIENFNIPKAYEPYITATKNSDGSWTLNVTSGYNIALTPTATLIVGGTTSGTNDTSSTTPESQDIPKNISVDISVSSDSDSSDDSSGGYSDFTASLNQNNMQAPPSSMMNPQLTVNSVDFTGMGLSAQLSDVLKPIDNLTAINNFTATDAQLPSTENMMACGIVDFQNAFVNAATGSVDVPVTANVIAGQTYTVALSNGQTLQVTCMANGVLNIPFMANAQNLTFIIYGMQANPAMVMFAGDTNQFQDALA